MKQPFIYPEPNLYKSTYGYFDAGKHSEAFHRIMSKEEFSPGTDGPLTLRRLEEADIERMNSQYFTKFVFAETGRESFFIMVRSDRIEVATGGDSGFTYALKTLRQLITQENTIKNGSVFYHPFREQRQVCMNLPNRKENEYFLKVLNEIADLKYNFIVFKNGDRSDLPPDAIQNIENLCRRNRIESLICPGDQPSPNEAAFELDASSVSSWELRTRFTKHIETIGPAKVSYPGEIKEEAMIQDGFIFRLVIGSYALNYFEFANSTWEKVLPQAMERTFLFMNHVHGMKMPSRLESADRYPVLSGNRDHDLTARNPVSIIPFHEERAVSEIEESSDSVVFRHSVIAEKEAAVTGEKIGYYTVHYDNGEQERIDLMMDHQISCETVKWNHAFNPVTHNYDTDQRLHRVSYRTRPRLHAKETSQVVTLYDFEWINPKSGCAINKITAAVTNPKYRLCVYGVDNIISGSRP